MQIKKLQMTLKNTPTWNPFMNKFNIKKGFSVKFSTQLADEQECRIEIELPWLWPIYTHTHTHTHTHIYI